MSSILYGRNFVNFNKKIAGYITKLNCQTRPYERRGIKYQCHPFMLGGGLEKPQGSPSEEIYFNLQDIKLFLKIRDQVKHEKCVQTSGEFDQVAPDKKPKESHESSSITKYKILKEELFFLNQESEKLQQLVQKIKEGFDWFKNRE